MDAKERARIRELNALRFSNLQNITLKQVVEAKQVHTKALATIRSQKGVYTDDNIAEQTAKAKSDYAAKLAGFHQDLMQQIDQLQASIAETQKDLDLSDTGLSNALRLIELGGQELGAENILKINESFRYNQPALRALQAVYKSRGLKYDGGIDKMVYDLEGTFNRVRQAAEATFKNQSAGINSFASQLAKVARFEGYEFEASPDPDGFAEAARVGAGLPAE